MAGNHVRHLAKKEAKQEIEYEHVIKVYTSNRTWYLIGDEEQDIIEWSNVLRKAALMFRGRQFTVDINLFTADKENCRYPSIQQAIAQANDLDVITILPGSYNETLSIKKSLIIEGVGNVVIESKSGAPVVTMETSACKLVNVTVINHKGKKEVNAIEIREGNVVLEHCDVTSGSASAVNVINQAQVTLLDCRIHDAAHYGVWLSNKASGLFEEGNEIRNCMWDGIMLMGESDAVVRQTKVIANEYNGIAVSSSGRCTVENCEVAYNKWDGLSINSDKCSVKLYDNKSHHNAGFGIYFAKKIDSLKADNDVYLNGKGQIYTL
jgi:parallel beta-helix repeat protein